MKLTNEDSTSRLGGKCFRSPSPEVKLHCTDEASFGIALAPSMSVPKDLAHLADLVANPNADEAVWMNACIGAGERSLVPKYSFMARLNQALKSTLGSIVAMLTFILNFSVTIFLTAEVAWFTQGLPYDNFVRDFAHGEAAGFLIGMCAAMCFWMSLLIKKNALSGFIQYSSIFLLSLAILFGVPEKIGQTIAIPLEILALVGIFASKYIGKLCRECLPASFKPAKLAQSAISLLLVPAAFTSWLIYMAVYSPDVSQNHENGTMASFTIFGSILAFCLAGQGFAMARASKAVSKSACAFLATCVQAPLFVALVVSVFVSAAMAGIGVPGSIWSMPTSPDWDLITVWQNIGVQRAFFVSGAMLAALGLSAGGGYLGALANAASARKSNPDN